MTRDELDAQKKENKDRFDRTIKRGQLQVDNIVARLKTKKAQARDRPLDADKIEDEISAVLRAWNITEGELRSAYREEDRALVEKFNAELD